MQCENLSTNSIKLQYRKKSLTSYFGKYNECKNSLFVDFERKNDKEKFSFSIKSGLMLNALSILNSNTEIVKHNNLVGYKIGLSFGHYLPFNNNKWTLLAEPAFQMFKFDKTSPNSLFPNETVNTVVDYKSIELSLGIRQSIFLNQASTIFINGFTVIDFPLVLEIEYKNSLNFENKTPLLNFSIGAGFEYLSRYSVELRYSTNRNLLNDFIIFDGKLRGIALVLGYKFLET